MIGKKVHALRKSKGLSLQQLAASCGLSNAFLSKVERELTSPSVTSLASIARALDVSPSYFFPPPPGECEVVRSYNHHPFTLEDASVIFARLGNDRPDRQLEPLLVTYPPNFTSEAVTHVGEEFLYVLEGRLTLHLDDIIHQLTVGDSVHYQSLRPHALENPGDIPTRILFVNSPRVLD